MLKKDMGVFSNLFSKRKKIETDQLIKYECVGVKYFNPNADAIDEIKEAYFKKFRQLNKVYTNSDLDEISKKGLLNVRECFYWVKPGVVSNTRISVVKKFIGVNPSVEKIWRDAIEQSFKELRPLTMVDIQNVKFDIQFEVFNNCVFKSIAKVNQDIDGVPHEYYFPSY